MLVDETGPGKKTFVCILGQTHEGLEWEKGYNTPGNPAATARVQFHIGTRAGSARQHRHPYLALFDGADPNASTAARQTTTVPTQALYFINDPVFHAQAAAVAEKLVSLPDDDTRIAVAWRRLLQRTPTAPEGDRARSFLAAYPAESAEKWAAQVRVLMASNEFLHTD